MQKIINHFKMNAAFAILLTTLVCLFGGHFIYQSQFVEKPLGLAIQSIPNVSLQEVAIQSKNVKVVAETTPQFSLTQYAGLREKIQSIVGHRKVELQLMDQPDVHLNTVWQKMVFGVQEGLMSKKFTQVYDTVRTIAKENDVKSDISMDDRYLYIEIRHDQKYIFRVYSLDEIDNEVKNND